MKIECVKEQFEEAVIKASRFTTKNESLPVLECIYLETQDSGVIVRSTNLNLGIEIIVPAEVVTPGKTAVPGAVLKNLLSGIEGEKKIILETSHENLTVSSRKSTTLIKSHRTEDFPTLPRVEGSEVFSLPVAALQEGIRSVLHSASTSSVKPEISSVYIYKEGAELVFVATDSFRLSEKRIPLKEKINFSSTIIPYRNVLEISRILETLTGEVDINNSKNQLSLVARNFYLTSRLVDGVFPDYKQIIPKEFKTEVVVLKNELLSAIKITNIFSGKFSKVLFRISVEQKYFEVEARNADVGENTTRIDAKLSGEDLSVGFNYHYLLDVFNTLKEDSISLDFAGFGKALVIKGLGDESFTYLVMPMNK